jgi:formate dehydrogenase subunit gamma
MAGEGSEVKNRWSRRRRAMTWSFAAILVGALTLPFTGYLYVAINVAHAQQGAREAAGAADQQSNPRANYWRAVRQGYEGYTAASGPYTTNVLIQNGGQNWRQLRDGPVESIDTWLLAIVVGAILAFAIVRGRVRLRQPPSGRSVERWSMAERVLHWYTAVLFIVLSITGLSLLFGRSVLIPLMGYAGFSSYANVAIALHNYIGPFFVIGVLLEIVAWIRYALPDPKVDGEWLRRGGGFFGGGHPHAGHINPGEKYITFWLGLVVLGCAVSITGIVMDFPMFGLSREGMQTSNVIHALAGIFWLALMLGHMYLGAWGVEGALPGMVSGRVSVEFAKEHHDLWYESTGRKTEQAGEKPARNSPRTA